jgi:hypothetical protein
MEHAPLGKDAAHDLEAFLLEVDATLDAEEQRREERRVEEMRRLEDEHERLAAAVAKAAERTERARGLDAGDVLVEIDRRLAAAAARLKEIVALLGYDPVQRREEREREARGERARDLATELASIEQGVGLLETGLGNMPKPAIAARVHELACRAKLAQQKFGDIFAPKQHERVRGAIFGRLHAILKDTHAGFVPSLRESWMPVSLEAEVEKAGRDFAAAMAGRASASGAPPTEPSREDAMRRVAERLDVAERWALAEVYRWSNACYERPGDADAAARLRQAALHAQQFLEKRKEELPWVLRHDAPLFAEGGDFRWLRRRLAKLEEGGQPEAAEAQGPEEAAGALETPTGERVLHPSVLRALPHTRGKRIVMVGGAVRAERRERLRRLFEAETFEWVPYERGGGQRGVEQVSAQMRAGTPDLVICLLGFMSHGVSQEIGAASRASGVPCAMVPHGYGEVAVAHAIVQTCAADHARSRNSAATG